MLKPSCQAFREAYSPHDPASHRDPHRIQCAACESYVQCLQDAAEPPAAGISNRLKQRLAAIPRQAMDCQDIDRLYGAVLQRAQGQTIDDPMALEHVEDCPRCRPLFACLSDAVEEAPRPLPEQLFDRLRRIGRQPSTQLPFWIADSRYATAACYLLTAGLVLLAGDASARFQATTEVVSAQASTWLGQGLDGTVETLGLLGQLLKEGLDHGRGWLLEQADALWQSLNEAIHRLHDRYRQLDLDPRHWFSDGDLPDSTHTEGESDGRS